MRQRARDVDPKGGVRRRSPLRRLTARSALRRRAQTNPARKSVLATGTHRRHRARRLIHTRVRRLSRAARATQTQLNQMRRLVKAGAGSNFRDNASAQVHTAPEASASSVTTAQPDSTGDRTGIPSLRGYEYTLLSASILRPSSTAPALAWHSSARTVSCRTTAVRRRTWRLATFASR